MESMTSAPHLLPKSRTGIKYGTDLLDHMAADGLWDVYTDQSMGALTDAGNCGGCRSAGPTRTLSPPARTSGRPRRPPAG